jgi:hypothetical protein
MVGQMPSLVHISSVDRRRQCIRPHLVDFTASILLFFNVRKTCFSRKKQGVEPRVSLAINGLVIEVVYAKNHGHPFVGWRVAPMPYLTMWVRLAREGLGVDKSGFLGNDVLSKPATPTVARHKGECMKQTPLNHSESSQQGLSELIDGSRRRALAMAAILGLSWSASAMARAEPEGKPPTPPPLGEGQIEAATSVGSTARLLARARMDRGGAALWIQNTGDAILREVHAVVKGLAATALDEEFFVRFQWSGALAPKAWAFAGAVGCELVGERLARAGQLAITVEHARSDVKKIGQPAAWIMDPASRAFLEPEMIKGVDADLARARGYAKAKGGKAPLVGSFAKMWARPGRNPYDPVDVNVAFAWRSASDKPVSLRGLQASFFSNPSMEVFLKAKLEGDWSLAPGTSSMSWASFGFPNASVAARSSFEARAKAHGVDMGRMYIDSADPSAPDPDSKRAMNR